MRPLVIPGIIALFSVVIIYLALQLRTSPPLIVGASMQPRSFPIFLMVINLLLVGIMIWQNLKNMKMSRIGKFREIEKMSESEKSARIAKKAKK